MDLTVICHNKKRTDVGDDVDVFAREIKEALCIKIMMMIITWIIRL